jgi:hypothetical protein
MGFENVRLVTFDARANLVEACEQVVGAVVREWGARDAHHVRAHRESCGGTVFPSIFRIEGARRDDGMFVTKLAQKVTS